MVAVGTNEARISLVDFTSAVQTKDGKDKELEKLMSLLPNQQKHTKEGNHTVSYLKLYDHPEVESGSVTEELTSDESRPKKRRQ
jgi:hypothetical protein